MDAVPALSAADVQHISGRTASAFFGGRAAAQQAAIPGSGRAWQFAAATVEARLATLPDAEQPAARTRFVDLVGVEDARRGAFRGMPTTGAARLRLGVGVAAAALGAASLLAMRAPAWHASGAPVPGSGPAASPAAPAPPPMPAFALEPGATTSALQADITRSFAALPDGSRSRFLVWDVESGAVQAGTRPDARYVPASVTKLFTALAALDALGPDATFPTELLGSGPVRDGVLHGDLVLRGSGDPELSRADLATLVAQLRAAGVSTVEGGLQFDDSAFDRSWYAPTQAARHLGSEVEPVGALMLQEHPEGRDGDPGLATAQELRTLLHESGITIGAGVRRADGGLEDARPLASISSRPLGEIVATMNRRSDNTLAEAVHHLVGRAGGQAGSTATGNAQVRARLERLGVRVANSEIHDGSGLTYTNLVRLDAVAGVLQAGAKHPDAAVRDAFLASLAQAGDPAHEGTLRRRLTDLDPARHGVVTGKTGTLETAITRAGFVAHPDGTRSGYVVMTMDPSPAARAVADEVTRGIVRHHSPG